MSARRRLHSIDGLRGLMALAVMLYHLGNWSGGVPWPLVAGMLKKAGIYAVCGFFVISGYSLYWTYGERLTKSGIAEYLQRRWLRIAPLFYVAILLTLWEARKVANVGLPEGTSALGTLLLNASLMFGFFRPGSTSYVTGGWSIGVEFVFYLLFPLVLIWGRGRRGRLGVVALLAFLCSLLWGELVLDPQRRLGEQWGDFVSPVYYAVYFFAGVWLASLARTHALSARAALAGCLACIVAFLLAVPLPADQTEIVRGLPFLVLMPATVGLVGFAAQLPAGGEGYRRGCELLGNASYALYLLHPIVFQEVARRVSDDQARVVWTIAITLPVSLLVYRYYERRFMTPRRLRAAAA